jgi:hypothetical protein
VTNFPFVRAGVLRPWVRWMDSRGQPTEELLGHELLRRETLHDWYRLIGMGSAASLMERLVEIAGPDLAARIGCDPQFDPSLPCLASRTNPVERALNNLAASVNNHFTHLTIGVERLRRGGACIRGKIHLPLTPKRTHILQQYVVE